jgi:hypothetical protein
MSLKMKSQTSEGLDSSLAGCRTFGTQDEPVVWEK